LKRKIPKKIKKVKEKCPKNQKRKTSENPKKKLEERKPFVLAKNSLSIMPKL